MSTRSPNKPPRAIAHLLCALAMLAGAHGATAANMPLATAPEGFGAGTTGGGQTKDIVTVHTAAQLAHELCRTLGPSGRCSDTSPRVIKLGETIDFTGTEKKDTARVCNVGKVCTAPYKNPVLIPVDANDHRCDKVPMWQIDVDKAGKNPLLVGSNKTLLGVGAHAGLKGKGLNLDNVSNVIIRNITISDINPGIIFGGDAVTISNSHHVWFDHNRVYNIARQMLVAHFGMTTNITVSWNIFDGNSMYSPNCNGQHYYNLLMAGNPQTVTVSNNWFKNVSGRAPHIDSPDAKVHLVNNYFDNDEWTEMAAHALDATPNPGTGVNVLVEANYFSNFAIPITGTSSNVFGSLRGPSAAMQTQCKSVLERNCYGNIVKPTPSDNHFVQDSAVMKAFLSVPQTQIVTPYTATDAPVNVPAHAGPGKI